MDNSEVNHLKVMEEAMTAISMNQQQEPPLPLPWNETIFGHELSQNWEKVLAEIDEEATKEIRPMSPEMVIEEERRKLENSSPAHPCQEKCSTSSTEPSPPASSAKPTPDMFGEFLTRLDGLTAAVHRLVEAIGSRLPGVYLDLPVYKEPVSILMVSNRAINALRRRGLHTIGDVCEKTEEEIGSIRGMGEKCVREIVSDLRRLGVRLR